MKIEESEKLVSEIIQHINEYIDVSRLSNSELEQCVNDAVYNKLRSGPYSMEDKVYVARTVFSKIRGLDILGNLFSDETVSEIIINGPQKIYYVKDGRKLEYAKKFSDERELEAVIERLINNAGKNLNTASPIYNVTLPDGTSLSVAFPPVTDMLYAVIRKAAKFNPNGFLMRDFGSEVISILQNAVKNKSNIIISGKNVLERAAVMRMILWYVPAAERIAIIQEDECLDSTIDRDGIVLYKKDDFTTAELVGQAVKMSADRIMVTGTDDDEAFQLLCSMNKCGGFVASTDARSCVDAAIQLEINAIKSAGGIPPETVRKKIVSTVDMFIQISSLPNGSSVLSEICTVEKPDCPTAKTDEVKLVSLFSYKQDK